MLRCDSSLTIPDVHGAKTSLRRRFVFRSIGRVVAVVAVVVVDGFVGVESWLAVSVCEGIGIDDGGRGDDGVDTSFAFFISICVVPNPFRRGV